MGAFITNCHVRSDSTDAVCKALKPFVRARAYVSPPKNGWVTVYDEASDKQDQETLCRITRQLSKTLRADAIAFMVHDSDIAQYWLYRRGAIADEFNSCPDYFGNEVHEATRARVVGRPELLLPLCIVGTTQAEVEEVIHPPGGPWAIAEDMLPALGKLLGIDEVRVGLGFNYFEHDNENLLPDSAEFEAVGVAAKGKPPEKPTPNRSALPDIAMPEPFDLAIGMMAQVWNSKHEIMVGKELLSQLRSNFDRMARDVLRHSTLANRPTLDELKAARDQGPEALAELLARRVPDRLPGVAVGAVTSDLDQFLLALLVRGLDPNAKDDRGVSPLGVAEQTYKDSKVHQLLKNWPAR